MRTWWWPCPGWPWDPSHVASAAYLPVSVFLFSRSISSYSSKFSSFLFLSSKPIRCASETTNTGEWPKASAWQPKVILTLAVGVTHVMGREQQCIQYHSHPCDQTLDQKQFIGGKTSFGSQFEKVQSIMAGKVWQWEQLTFIVVTACSSSFSFLSGSESRALGLLASWQWFKWWTVTDTLIPLSGDH